MDVETREFLVKYKTSSKVVKFSGEGTLKDKIRKVFGISNGKEIKLQRYQKEWDDYIDISDSEVEVLVTHEKLKCEVNDTVCSDSASDCASASGSNCSSSIIHTQSNIWPKQFLIPTHKYSKMLERNLKEEKQLNWSNKHELLQILVDEIFKYTYYPKTVEIMSVAKCLIDTHPYLTERLGNGYDGWIQIIRDKLKNARREINDPSVVWHKRKNSENRQDTDTGKRKRITPKGKNCLAGHPPGEDDTSCKTHVENMKKEMKNPQRDMELIQELMAKTFGYRRRFINECPPVSSVIAEYPALKLCDVMKEEMSRLEPKETDCLKSFLKNCVRYSGGLIEVARKKKGSACHEALKYMDDEIDGQTEITPAEFGNFQCLTSLVLLPELLGDENKMFINCYAEDSSLETVCKGPRTPYVAVIGSALKPTAVYIVTEGEVVNTVRDLKEGLFYALCAYYVFNIEYPGKCQNSWTFVQMVLSETEGNERPPKKVLTLRGKIG